MNYPGCTGCARHRQDEIVANAAHLMFRNLWNRPVEKQPITGSNAVNNNENVRGVYGMTIINAMKNLELKQHR